MCPCLVSESASICGEGCVERICYKSSIVVCIPMVFNVRVVMVERVCVDGMCAFGGGGFLFFMVGAWGWLEGRSYACWGVGGV